MTTWPTFLPAFIDGPHSYMIWWNTIKAKSSYKRSMDFKVNSSKFQLTVAFSQAQGSIVPVDCSNLFPI